MSRFKRALVVLAVGTAVLAMPVSASASTPHTAVAVSDSTPGCGLCW